MPDSRTLWTAVVIICIAVSVFFSVKKRTTFKRLQQLMAAKQWDEFDRLLDGKLTSMLYPRYNRDYLRLNSYLLREDHKRADEMFDLLLGLNLPKMQRVDLVIKAFNYYVGQEDRKKSKELLHEIKGFEGGQAEAVAHECQLMYDTMILKRHNDIPELERMLEDVGDDPVKRCRLEYLLALNNASIVFKDGRYEVLPVAAAVPLLRTVQVRLTSSCGPAVAGAVNDVTASSAEPIVSGTA